MKRRMLPICLLLVLAGCNQGVPPKEKWVAFTTPDGVLSIDFPAKPDIIDRPVNLPTGNVVMKCGVWENGKLVLMANSLKMPGEMRDDISQEEMLDSMANGAAGAVNGRILEQNDVTVDGHAARELFMEVPDGPTVRAHLLFLPDVPAIVNLQVLAGTEAETTSRAAADFLDSAVIND